MADNAKTNVNVAPVAGENKQQKMTRTQFLSANRTIETFEGLRQLIKEAGLKPPFSTKAIFDEIDVKLKEVSNLLNLYYVFLFITGGISLYGATKLGLIYLGLSVLVILLNFFLVRSIVSRRETLSDSYFKMGFLIVSFFVMWYTIGTGLNFSNNDTTVATKAQPVIEAQKRHQAEFDARVTAFENARNSSESSRKMEKRHAKDSLS